MKILLAFLILCLTSAMPLSQESDKPPRCAIGFAGAVEMGRLLGLLLKCPPVDNKELEERRRMLAASILSMASNIIDEDEKSCGWAFLLSWEAGIELGGGDARAPGKCADIMKTVEGTLFIR